MSEQPGNKLAGFLLVVLYPLLIYLGLKFLDPRWVALLLVVLVGLRFLRGRMPLRAAMAMGLALLTATGLTLVTGSALGLLLYPVMVNAALFFLFALSLLYPPSIIESFARLQEPDLPAAAVAYTRKVTWIWSIFFLVNGTLAALTVTQSHEYWVLYNGFIAYVLIGVLMLGEWLVRRRVMERHRA